MDEKQITENIIRLRKAKNMSIDQLAKAAGLTRGYISKIENSHKAPPLSTLFRIAQALGTDLPLLIVDDASLVKQGRNLCIVRANERKAVVARGTLYGYSYESLAYGKAGKNMEAHIIEVAFDEKGVFSHEGEEFMFTLEGTHEFTYNNEKYILKEGDSCYYDSIVPHTGRSIGTKKAKVLAVTYSYKR
jgi:transcriptional regulator with XRE-family HTH domain